MPFHQCENVIQPRARSRVLTLLLASLALLGAASAPIARAQAAADPLWTVKEGLGLSYHLHERNSDERQIVLAPEFSKPFGRHWEYVIEAHLSRFTSPAGYFAGLLPVGVRYSPLDTRVRPFVSVDLGFGWTDLTNIPEISRRFNYVLEGDLGARWKTRGGQSWQVSGRFSHISNGGTTEPNLGLNSLLLLVGCSVN